MELVRFPSHGGFSVRSSIMFVLAVLAAALLWTTLTPTTTHAADAEWSGSSIIYDTHGYTEATGIIDTTNTIPKNATVYKTPFLDAGNGDKKVFILYFAPGVDPPTATSASYAEFTYKNNQLSNVTNKKTVSLSLKSDQKDSSSCSVTGGIGWIVCPVTNFLAGGMDTIFSVLSGMLKAQPLVLGDSSNSMYRAWDMFRSIANIAFVIAFMIIIYSQLTSFGVSSYGIKKLIPRLIVAAVLVNLSYYIMAVAIDISNVLGFSVQELFNTIRSNVVTITNDNIGSGLTNGWATVTSIVLAGGGTIAGIAYLSTGAYYMLAPLLVGLGLTILLVLFILAARQAIIVVLVILAPLAFVANLLPNTEKWFTKWKDLFMTMMIFFPAFSAVFGGSQLAGQIIIQNAGDNLFMVIFGMAAQIAPLAITPLIMKFSGGLLGKIAQIAQIANNPNKGVIDRSRNWAGKKAERVKEENLTNGPRLRNPTTWGTGLMRRMNYRGRNLDNDIANWSQAATNRYEQSKGFRKTDEHRARVELDKESVQNKNATRIENLKATKGTRLHDSSMRAATSKDTLEESQGRLTAYYNTQRITPGTALNRSTENLEAQKSYTEATERDKAAHLNKQRTYRTTMLGAAAERLETAKLNETGWQDAYTAHIDTLKVDGTAPSLKAATVFAQTKKEHSEGAQLQVQAMFDRDRAITGTELNKSNLSLENAKMVAEQAKSQASRDISDAKANTDGVLHVQYTRTEAAKSYAQESEARVKSVIEEYKAGHVPDGAPTELKTAIETLRSGQQTIGIETLRAGNATKVQNTNLSDALIADESLRTVAGGIRGKLGVDAALASAINAVRTAESQSVNEARQIVKHFNLSSAQRQDLALGKEVTAVRDDGTSHTFGPDDTYARESALEDQIAVGTIPQIEEILAQSGTGGKLSSFRTTIAAALASNGTGGKSIYLGGKTIDDTGKGRFNSQEDIMAAVAEAIGNGKISAKDLASIDPLAAERFLQVAERIKNGDIPAGTDPKVIPTINKTLDKFSEIARNTLTGEQSDSVKGKAADFIEQIGQIGDPSFKAPSSGPGKTTP